MKILLMFFLLPITVCAAMPMYGSASATIENRKGVYVFSTEEDPMLEEEIAAVDELMVDVDFDSGEEATAEEIEFDEPTVDDELIFTAEEQDLADTLLSDEVREE